MNIIVAFWLMKHAGMEGNRMQLARRCHNGKYGCECIVRGISLDCDWGVQQPVGENWSHSESILQGLEGRTALISKVPSSTLAGELCEWNCDLGVFVNEVMVKVGESEEGLDVLHFPRPGPILDNLDFIGCHHEALRR